VDVSAAARAIKRGEIIGVPTDTVYGLAADPYDEAALDRLYDIKGRDDGKPIAILVADLDHSGPCRTGPSTSPTDTGRAP
jgi:L-threonylcarbamoyladenylate synthase